MLRNKLGLQMLVAAAMMAIAGGGVGHAVTAPTRRESDTDRAARLQKRTEAAATNAERDAWNARVDARNRAKRARA